jgi:hypothetical protein
VKRPERQVRNAGPKQAIMTQHAVTPANIKLVDGIIKLKLQDLQEKCRKLLWSAVFSVQVRMLRGTLPSDNLLEKFQLQEYRNIKDAVQSGDVSLLLRSLEENQVAFVQAGTYLLLEKLLLSTYRRLFRKWVVEYLTMISLRFLIYSVAPCAMALIPCYIECNELYLFHDILVVVQMLNVLAPCICRVAVVHAEMNPAKATQLPLALLHRALEMQGLEKDNSEFKCGEL